TLAATDLRIANGLVRLPGVGLIKKLVGIASERTLPAFARKTFRATFAKHTETGVNNKRVMLWPDTFNNNFRPDTLNAAVEVLEAAGFSVTSPEVRLCGGRPLYDQGFLDMAAAYVDKTLTALREPIAKGIPAVVLEPSGGA